MKFCFPLIDIDLSPKRVEILTKRIKVESGTVIPFQDRQIEEAIDYLLISPNAKIENVLKKVQKKIEFKKILDFNFIINTTKAGILLAIQTYVLHSNHMDKDELLEEETMTIIAACRKLNKV